MNKVKNEYAEKAKRKALAGTETTDATLKTKGNIGLSAKVTGKDILIGGLGGALAGNLIGRPSLLIGIAVSGAGHFMGSPSTAMFGVGLMASGGVKVFESIVNGTEKKGIETVKERFNLFAKNLKHQLYLDKLIPAKKKTEKTEEEESTNGVGNVQYFQHPNPDESEMNGNKDLDFSEANRIEQQLEASAKAYAEKQGMSGDFSKVEDVNGTEDINGTDDMNGADDISERLM